MKLATKHNSICQRSNAMMTAQTMCACGLLARSVTQNLQKVKTKTCLERNCDHDHDRNG